MSIEQSMYDILVRISDTDAPLIFKGALITKLILMENDFTELDRATKDIDANWIGSPPTLEELVEIIKISIGDLNEKYNVTGGRESSERKTAGINFSNQAGDRLFTMDINMWAAGSESREYYWGEGIIRGVIVDEILADKISVLSSTKIFRRAKDLVDVYAFSKCVNIDRHRILTLIEQKGNTLEDFDAFVNRKNDLEHAYNKLHGVENKPEFTEVYENLNLFLKPFINKCSDSLRWDSRKWVADTNHH